MSAIRSQGIWETARVVEDPQAWMSLEIITGRFPQQFGSFNNKELKRK